MSRPLLITDCDEVLLHMVSHFAEWLEETHGYQFALEEPGFADAIRDAVSGEPIPAERVWPLLSGFFDSEMYRQNVVPGAVEALKHSTSATACSAIAAERARRSPSCWRRCSQT
jgi:hypothetical protein